MTTADEYERRQTSRGGPLHTPLCDVLGIEYPLISAPIGAAGPEMVAAVCNAGALGLYAGTWRSPEVIRRGIRRIRALTDRPFGVNLTLEWSMEERLEVCLEEGVSVISLWWGEPGDYVLRAREGGARVLFTVGDRLEAARAVDAGVDVVVAQGVEAGGHVRGAVGTIALVPSVADHVAPVPVVAAGGIADGRGVAAALALGAAGAWLGTRFLMAAEGRVHEEYQRLVARAHGEDTVRTELFDVGWAGPHRVLRNSTLAAWKDVGEPPSGARPGEGRQIGSTVDGEIVQRYEFMSPERGTTGEIEAMPLYAGQGVGLISQVQPAASIVEDLVAETRQALGRASAASV